MIKFEGLREALHLNYPHPELIAVLKAGSVWSARSGWDLRITSLNDHIHTKPTKKNPRRATSLHYSDLAVDFVVQHGNGQPNKDAMAELAQFFRDNLGAGYDILHGLAVKHESHIHVEWDINQRPRRNRSRSG
jgi:hypothetical protein